MAGTKRKKALRRPPDALAYWMGEVLRQHRRAGRNLEEKPVHDLRAALRRCRSLAEGIRDFDDHKRWRRFSEEIRSLFRPLGNLRDIQVELQWLEKLGGESDPIVREASARLRKKAQCESIKVRRAIEAFDREQWRGWTKKLPERLASLDLPEKSFLKLGRRSCAMVGKLHERALASGIPANYHALRIAAKRFRYTAENFLPAHYAKWKKKLSVIQDALGAAQDLEVLEAQLRAYKLLSGDAGEAWRKRLHGKQEEYFSTYRALVTGNLWARWGRELGLKNNSLS
ncbi:MAG: CHAD domain-containing protein [Bdellovibrionota bacterium]